MIKYVLYFASIPIFINTNKNTCNLPDKTGLLIRNMTSASNQYLIFEISCSHLYDLYYKKKKMPSKVVEKFLCDDVYKNVAELEPIDFFSCYFTSYFTIIIFAFIMVCLFVLLSALVRLRLLRRRQINENRLFYGRIDRFDNRQPLTTILEEMSEIEDETGV
ncbi:hypothetical protein MHBO_004603 [Bonamia ostreae]|uniref:Uncharacterized protein n=1 Tax=Bonamia ostreae TaxID=126728 RepID=A0ABV2ATU3_9EUKA